jgi:hypothetical protein
MKTAAPLLLIGLWACLLVIFIVVGPSPYSRTFWLLLGVATFCGGLYMLLSRQESRKTQRETAEWHRQLRTLVDIQDYEDDGHLAEYLDEGEQRRVIEELGRMPPGSRSLRRALRIVSPELINEER